MPTTTAEKRRGRPPGGTMTDEHKEALAAGREQGRIIRSYLEALESHKPKRGRKRTPESIQKRLAEVLEDLEDAAPLQRLQLTQERIDLENELEWMQEDDGGMEEQEAAFIEVAADYSLRKGISYEAWRTIGVPAAVLKQAGIRRSGIEVDD